MYRTAVDLNCDMGEGFGHWSYGEAPDDALMKIISSANVACGYHGGDALTMTRCVELAKEHGVREQVKLAFKRAKARKPLTQRAEQLAQKVRDGLEKAVRNPVGAFCPRGLSGARFPRARGGFMGGVGRRLGRLDEA